MGIPFDGHCIPIGRHPATVAEVRQLLGSLPNPKLRLEILGEWEQMVALFRADVGPLAACWLSGSLFTDKPDPGDIDALFIAHHKMLDAVTSGSDGHRLVGLMRSWQVKSTLKIRVDAPILVWWPRPGPRRGADVTRLKDYLETRGYWDDLWSREKNTLEPRLDSLIRRGYLEVIIDGYVHPSS